MKRLVTSAAVAIAVATLIATAHRPDEKARRRCRLRLLDKPFTVVEATIPEMQAALKAGRVTSREIVRQYLQRIGMYEELLHAAITVNPKALELAEERDRERAAGQDPRAAARHSRSR